jgi:chromate reductase
MRADTATMKLLALSGSLRAGSFNTSLLRLVERVLPANATLDVAEIGDIPLYNLDVEQDEGFPEPVLRLRQQMAAADGLIISTPEYNFSIPGVLKNAIDWASRHADSPMNHKPVAIAGVAGGSGSRRAQTHLRTILGHNRMRVMARPELLVASGGEHFEEGEPIEHSFVERVAQWAGAFVTFIERVADLPRLEPGTVLIVGRDHDGLRLAHDRLGEYGIRAIGTLSDDEAVHAIEHRGVAALVIGAGVGDAERATLAKHLEALRPEAPLVVLTHPDDAGAAVLRALGLTDG